MTNKGKQKTFKEVWETSWVALEVRVAKLLREMWWNVEVNQFYLDPYTEKPREIDIIADRSYIISTRPSHFGWITEEKVQMRIFIECKYIKDIILLFSKDRDEAKTMKAFMSIVPYAKLNEGATNRTLPTWPDNHRYFKQNKVVHQSDDNSERWFWINWAQQLFHWISSKTRASQIQYKVDYWVILVKDFSNIWVSYLGNEPEGLKEPTFFIMDYVDNTGKPTYSIADIISEEWLRAFVLDREAEFELLKSSITTMRANEERYKRIEETRREQEEWTNSIFGSAYE